MKEEEKSCDNCDYYRRFEFGEVELTECCLDPALPGTGRDKIHLIPEERECSHWKNIIGGK